MGKKTTGGADTMKDYYAVLGIPETADAQEIKKAFRRLAKKYHPDAVGDDPEKLKRMYSIQEAYECRGNEENRKSYDESRRKQAGSMENRAPKRGGQEPEPAPDMGQFERFFGFQPGKGMETYQARKSGKVAKQGPICPDEMFSRFFGSPQGKRGNGR